MSSTAMGADRFHFPVDSLPELIWVSGTDRLCIYFNRQWLTFTGRTLEQELGNGWIEGMHPDDCARCADIYASVFDTREAFTMEYRLRRFDGKYRWVLHSGRPWFSTDGEFAGYIGSAIDITERRTAEKALRESEERFRQLAENINQVFWFMEVNPPRVLYVSPAFERIWGVSAQELYDDARLWMVLIHPDDLGRVERAFSAWIHGESGDFDVEYRIVSRDGKTRWLHDRGTAIYDEQGRLVRLSGIAEDISVRKQVAEERERLQRQLQQAQKMEAIGHLTGGIAHDFNNILASIIGYTGLALTRFVPDKQGKLAEYLQEVYRAAERARDLIAQMLTFSRGTGSQSKPHRLAPLVEDAMKLLHSTLPSSIQLRMQLADDTPAVMIDPVQLHQLMMNLCINARDAMGGRGCIDIRLHCVWDVNIECSFCHSQVHGDFVELVVKDTGKGIEPEVMVCMFDPFFSTKEPAKGSGMGLSIVHGIVHDHGGHIVVQSAPGSGSAFRLLFPRALIAPESVTGSRSQVVVPANEPTNGARVLVVDDEESVAAFIGELLDSRGYRVVVMTNSSAVLARFKDDPDAFDLVVMDQTMPYMTGLELAQALLDIRPELPVILCTGYSEEVDEARSKQLGIRGYLTKPLSVDELLGKVKELLQEQASLRHASPS